MASREQGAQKTGADANFVTRPRARLTDFMITFAGVVRTSTYACALLTARESRERPIASPRAHLTRSPHLGNGARPRAPIPLGDPRDPP